jgi:hypothetical protein
MHRHIQKGNDQQLVWKSGVQINGASLGCPNTVAEITEAWDNKQLFIRIQGSFSKDLMSKTTYEIDTLNESLFKQLGDDQQTQKSRWYKLIPCNCPTCKDKDSNEKHYYDYNKLLERKEFGKDSVECEKKPFAAVSISELLEGVSLKRVMNQQLTITAVKLS